MYCAKCGNKLGEGDRFCSKCGTPAATEPPEKFSPSGNESEGSDISDEIFDEPIEVIMPVNDFKWDVQYYPDSGNKAKTKAIEFDWGNTEDFHRRPERKQSIPADAFEGEAPRTEAAEDEAPAVEEDETKGEKINFWTGMKDAFTHKESDLNEEHRSGGEGSGIGRERESFSEMFEISETGNKSDKPSAKPGAEAKDPGNIEIQTAETVNKRLLDDDSSRAGEKVKEMAAVNKFYTFNSKNEEFQKLLDKEYERLGVKKSIHTESETDDKPFEILGDTVEPDEDMERVEREVAEKDLFATGELSIQEQYKDEINSFEQKEIREAIEREAKEAQEAAKAKREQEKQKKEIQKEVEEEWPEFDPGAHLNEMAKARELFFNDDVDGATLVMNRKKFSEALDAGMKEPAKDTEAAVESKQSDDGPEGTEGKEVEEVKEAAAAKEDNGAKSHANTAELEEELFGTGVPEGIPEDLPDMTKNKVKTKKPRTGSETQPVEMAEAAIEMAKYQNMKEGSKEASAADSFFDDDDDYEEKSGGAGRTAIVVLSVILVIMLGLLAVRIFFAETEAAIMIDNVSNSIVDWVKGIIGN